MKNEKNGKTYLHLCDFGIANDPSSKERKHSTCNLSGTCEYMAPEILNQKDSVPNI